MSKIYKPKYSLQYKVSWMYRIDIRQRKFSCGVRIQKEIHLGL